MCHRSRRTRTARTAGRSLDSDIRVSDADRDETVSRLRAAAAEGRLDMQELEQRVERAYASKLRRDLAALVDDLPGERLRRARDLNAAAFREHLRTYLSVMALLVVIWALTGMGYFWPVWPALGWGIGVFSHRSTVRPSRRPRALRASG